DHLVDLLPTARRDGLVEVAGEHEMWVEALDLLSHLSDQNRRRFIESRALGREGVLEAIVRAAAEHQLWPALLPLVPELPPASRERIAQEAAKLDPQRREEIAHRAAEAGLSDHLTLLFAT